jgi:hypothetical protein
MKKATERTRTSRHSEPSAASLKAIPEVDFTRARVRRNPYAARIARVWRLISSVPLGTLFQARDSANENGIGRALSR